jgi:phage gp29-like protein
MAIKKLPAELANEIATTGDGRDITKPFTTMLQQPKDTRLSNAVDWGAYDTIRADDQVKSCMQQRILAVISAEWDVQPGDEADPRSVVAAEALKANLAEIGFDNVTEKMAWSTFYGLQIAEILWQKPAERKDGLVGIKQIKVRHGRRFRFDKDNALRHITRGKPQGELVPAEKFWIASIGATNDDDLYGEGLAAWLYWPTYFKRNGIRFWNIFLDKFGTPTAVAKYRRGTPKAEIAKLSEALRALATDSGIVVPEGSLIELLQASKSGTGDFEKLCRYMDEAIAKIILSQTMTTQDGSSNAQAQVHAGVKLEVVKADADLLCESFNAGPARWWSKMNFGPDVAPPRVVRLVEEEADLKLLAETDAVLANQGWVRSDESFSDTYGDGYERKAEAAPVAAANAPKPDKPATNDNFAATATAEQKDKAALSFAATDPRPLYVYRSLKNSGELLKWAKAQGFTTTLPAADLHCTITYSKRAVDWLKMGSSWGPANGELIVSAGGPRLVEPLGDGGAVVLHFASDDFEWRHEQMVEDGASWDFPEYHPHITISYDGALADLSAVQPYQGKLVFGPEIFEPLDEDWRAGIKEASFAELQGGDTVDQLVADLLEEQGWRPLSPQLKAVINAIDASGSADSLDEALLNSLDKADSAALTQIMARTTFTARVAAELGEDG